MVLKSRLLFIPLGLSLCVNLAFAQTAVSPVAGPQGIDNTSPPNSWDTNGGNTGDSGAILNFTASTSLSISDSDSGTPDNGELQEIDFNAPATNNTVTLGNGTNNIELDIGSIDDNSSGNTIVIDADNGVGTGTSTLVFTDIDSSSGLTITLDDSGSNDATLRNDVGAFTVLGANVNGAAVGEGTVRLRNADATTASTWNNGHIGNTTSIETIDIGNDSEDSRIQFLLDGAGANPTTLVLDASTSGIVIGTLGAGINDDDNYIEFYVNDAATDVIQVRSNISGAEANDSNNLVLSATGDGDIQFLGDIGVNIDSISNTDADVALQAIAGDFSFTGTINATNITFTGEGDGADFDFDGDVASTNVTLDGGDGAGENISANFSSDVSSTITLDDNTGTVAMIVDGSSAQSISGTINTVDGNESSLTVTNTDTTSGATFTTSIGNTGSIAALNIGTTSSSGNATFNNIVSATTVTVEGEGGATTASFDNTVTGNLVIQGGDSVSTDTANAVITTTVSGGITLDDGALGDASVTFDGTTGTQTVGNAFTNTASEGAIIVRNTGTNASFTNALGGVNALRNITVGDSTNSTGGRALFANTVNADTILIDASDNSDAMESSASFNNTVTGAITLQGGDNATEVASATFDSDITGTIAFNDGSAGVATATFDAAGAQSISGAITATSNNEGNIVVTNTSGAGMTFNSTVGALGNAIDNINIGTASSNSGGNATFANDVHADIITIDATDTGGADSSDADFNANVTVNSIVLQAGVNAAELANASFAGDVSGSISLDDGTAGLATVTFDGTAAQTIANSFTNTDNEGAIIITNSNAGGATFSNDLGASNAFRSITVGANASSGGVANFDGNITATSINVGVADSSGEASTANFDGDVTGIFTIEGGDSAGEDASATVAGNIVGNTTLNSTGSAGASLTFDGSSSQTVTGTISGASTGEGTLVIDNDTVFSTDIGRTRLASVTVNANNSATLGSEGVVTTLGATNISVSGTITANDTIELGAGSTITFNNGATLSLADEEALDSLSSLLDADTNSATINIGSGGGDVVDVALPISFKEGEVNIIDGDGTGTVNVNGSLNLDTSQAFPFSNYTLTNNSGLITVEAELQSAAEIISAIDVESQQAIALREAIIATKGDSAAESAIDTAVLSGAAAQQDLAEQAVGGLDNIEAAVDIAASTANQVFNTVATHLASKRSPTFASAKNSGVATGGDTLGKLVWSKAFGNIATQDTSGNIRGFDSHTYGLTVGADLLNNEKGLIGGAFSYANTTVEGAGANSTESDITSLQASLYGDYNLNKLYFEGYSGLALNFANTSRDINIGSLNRVAEADYTSYQLTTKLEVGRYFNLTSNVTVTPTASLLFSHVFNSAYTETGADSLNLTVEPEDASVLDLSFGAKLAGHYTTYKGGHFKPELRAGISYDLAGDEAVASQKYAGGGSAFTVVGAEVEPLAINIGTSLDYVTDRTTLAFGYDGEYKSDYQSHTGYIELKYRLQKTSSDRRDYSAPSLPDNKQPKKKSFPTHPHDNYAQYRELRTGTQGHYYGGNMQILTGSSAQTTVQEKIVGYHATTQVPGYEYHGYDAPASGGYKSNYGYGF